MKENDQKILAHYKKVAETFGDRAQSTMKDHFIRQHEIDFLIHGIKNFEKSFERPPTVLDCGCGNGYTLSILSREFPHLSLSGVEFSPELLDIARKRDLNNVQFFYGDIREEIGGKFDIIFTERALINILSKDGQKRALKNIVHALCGLGQFMMIESFSQPLQNLNRLRKEFALPPIEVPEHNSYLNLASIAPVKQLGMREIDNLGFENKMSQHFFNSRIFHHLIRQEGMRIEETLFVQIMNQSLLKSQIEVSPIQMKIFQKNARC